MKNINLVSVLWDGRIVGKLALTKNGLCVFEYTSDYLSNGVSISPFELPLEKKVFIARSHPFGGGFGVFDDCLPDGWGNLILDRYLQKQGVHLSSLTILDRLALVGSTGRGALEFQPDQSIQQTQENADFEKLAQETETILASDAYFGESIEELQQRGGSPGGARPKVSVKADGKEWIVKFRAKEDPMDIGVKEYEYSLLAKQCGIEMPETRLFESKYFGVERFDRTQSGKLHVISMAGLLCADYRLPSIDYEHIFKVCAALTHNMAEMWKIFRLMAFNHIIGNKDDHAKNFAFIYRDGAWHFAPAYDILPSNGINGYRTTSINDSITPDDNDLVEVARTCGLNTSKATEIINEIRSIVSSNNF